MGLLQRLANIFNHQVNLTLIKEAYSHQPLKLQCITKEEEEKKDNKLLKLPVSNGQLQCYDTIYWLCCSLHIQPCNSLSCNNILSPLTQPIQNIHQTRNILISGTNISIIVSGYRCKQLVEFCYQ